MYWKLLISLLILPSYLGFDIVEASVKNDVSLPKSEDITAQSQQTPEKQNINNSSPFLLKEHSSTSTDQKADARKVEPINYERPYKIAHEYYYHYNRCHHGYRRYYRQTGYYPDFIDYRRSYYHQYFYPGYYHHYYYPRHYYNSGYYHHEYYHPRYYYNNGYYHHEYYHPRYYNNGYYYNGY